MLAINFALHRAAITNYRHSPNPALGYELLNTALKKALHRGSGSISKAVESRQETPMPLSVLRMALSTALEYLRTG